MENSIKIQVIHLTEEECYLVKLGSTFNHFEVSGLRVHGYQESVTVKSLDEIKCYRTIPSTITHFENNGTIMSNSDYKNSVDKLLSKGEDQFDDYVFDSLDDEYRYKKFIRDWRPVYSASYEERTPLEFVITEIRTNSGDPDIVSLWNSPTLNDNRLYSFDRHNFSLKHFKELCEEKQLNYDIPNHGGIRYAKIEMAYIFDDSVNYDRSPTFIGTLEQCKECKNSIAKYIENKVLLCTAKNTELLNSKEVLGKIQKVTGNLVKVQPVSKSRDSLNTVIIELNSLAAKIEADISNKVKEEENKS
jgi:hypothetical protein